MSQNGQDFMTEILQQIGGIEPFKPMAIYNPDGDCIEMHLSNEPYYARRLDGWVTVFYSEATDEVTGAMLKGVKSSLLKRFPGLRILIEGTQVRIAMLLTGPLSATEDDLTQRTYKAVIDKAAELDLRAELLCT